MTARLVMKKPGKIKAKAPALVAIYHPRWSSAEDYQILAWKGRGLNFHEIAEGLERPRIAVEQRFHKLRVIPECIKLLEAHGLSHDPYPEAVG